MCCNPVLELWLALTRYLCLWLRLWLSLIDLAVQVLLKAAVGLGAAAGSDELDLDLNADGVSAASLDLALAEVGQAD